jgi:hypothetical protein
MQRTDAQNENRQGRQERQVARFIVLIKIDSSPNFVGDSPPVNCPGGTLENSPVVHCWALGSETVNTKDGSPGGTDEFGLSAVPPGLNYGSYRAPAMNRIMQVLAGVGCLK